MRKKITLATGLAVMLSGCGSAGYYEAVTQNNEAYLKKYSEVKNESVTFEGTFNGKIAIIKPKKMPKLQHIQKPKTAGDYMMQTLGIVAPVALGVAGYHYNYKSTDSSNKYNAQTTEAWTGNFQNTNSVTNTTSDVTNTSVSDVANTNTQTVTPVIPTVTTVGTDITVGE